MTRYYVKISTLTKRLAPRVLAVCLALSAAAMLPAPLTSAAGSQACAMDCCAAVSHTGGACAMHSAAPPVVLNRDPDDPLCRPAATPATPAADSETIKVVAEPAGTAETRNPASRPLRTHISPQRMTAQCGQDCGSCGAATSHSRSGREAMAQSAVGVIEPGFANSLPSINNPATALRWALLRSLTPRGPPASSLA